MFWGDPSEDSSVLHLDEIGNAIHHSGVVLLPHCLAALGARDDLADRDRTSLSILS